MNREERVRILIDYLKKKIQATHPLPIRQTMPAGEDFCEAL